LSIVALDAIGGASLKGLDADSLAMDAIRNHPDSSRLHEAAFALLHSTIAVFDGRINDFAKEILDSIETHPGEEMLQVTRRWDVCRGGERSRSERERQADPRHGERELPQ